jgi:hypothetical protein
MTRTAKQGNELLTFSSASLIWWAKAIHARHQNAGWLGQPLVP